MQFQLLLLQQVPAPIGANNNQGVGLPVVFTVVQQQQVGAPNTQVQPNPPVSAFSEHYYL